MKRLWLDTYRPVAVGLVCLMLAIVFGLVALSQRVDVNDYELDRCFVLKIWHDSHHQYGRRFNKHSYRVYWNVIVASDNRQETIEDWIKYNDDVLEQTLAEHRVGITYDCYRYSYRSEMVWSIPSEDVYIGFGSASIALGAVSLCIVIGAVLWTRAGYIRRWTDQTCTGFSRLSVTSQ